MLRSAACPAVDGGHRGGADAIAYSAFVRRDVDYLSATWHPSTRPTHLQLDHSVVWTHLEIVRVRAGAAGDRRGLVEFRAFHTHGVQAERSRFLHEGGQWFYLDGERLD